MNSIKQFLAINTTGEQSVVTWGEIVLVSLIILFSCVAFLFHLERPYLWQDEAQTALIAETILERGLPYGTDGKNFFSQELGAEYGENYLWRWHPWLSFYVEAASLALLGKSTLAARLPFALLGIGCVLMAWILARTLWRSPPAGLVAAAVLATNVQFILFSRQARYYSLASFLVLLGIFAYIRLVENKKGGLFFLAACSALLFQTHYLYFGTLSLALGLHSLLFQRRMLSRTVAACSLGLAVNTPWVIWFMNMRYGEQYGDKMFNSQLFFNGIASYASELSRGMSFEKILYAAFAALAVALLRGWRRKSFAWNPGDWFSGMALLLFCGLSIIIVLALTNPAPFARYIMPVFAVSACLAGGLAAWSWRLAHPLFAILLFGVSFNPLLWHNFNYELHNHFPGPMEGISTFLNEHARPDDVVAITYGDLPVKFYTNLYVLGGLTGEDLEPAWAADWVIFRNWVISDKDARVRRDLLEHVDPHRYKEILLPYPDSGFEDRPDLKAHHFGRADRDVPQVRVYKRIF